MSTKRTKEGMTKKTMGLSGKLPGGTQPENTDNIDLSPPTPTETHPVHGPMYEIDLSDAPITRPTPKKNPAEEFAETEAEVLEYAKFLLKATKNLDRLEGNLYRSSEESFDRKQELTFNAEDLKSLIESLTARHKQQILKSPTNLPKQTRMLIEDIQALEQVATDLQLAYAHIKPELGRKFAATNNAALNRVLDKFIRFMHKVSSKFGFTEAAKKDVLADLQDIQKKHEGLRNKL